MQKMAKQTTIPTLHHMSQAQSWRILWALEELALSSNLHYRISTGSRGAEGRAPAPLTQIFPLGKVPMLTITPVADAAPLETYQIKPGVVTESRLILQFIADEYSGGCWEPESEEERRRDVFFQEFAVSSAGLYVTFAFMFQIIAHLMPFFVRPVVSVFAWFLCRAFYEEQEKCWGIMEGELSDEMPWFSGRKIGLADFLMSWPLHVAVDRGMWKEGKYPRVEEWYRRVLEREAHKRCIEKGGGMRYFDMKTLHTFRRRWNPFS